MLGTPAKICPTLSLVTLRSRMMRSSGVICGVARRLSTAFLKDIAVAPLEAARW